MHKFFLFFSVFVASSLGAKQTICLNMIVKDETHVIKRALDSVRPYIDYWIIVDTGSSDGTQELIKEHLKDIPGELIEKPWVNFGHNRTEALNLAKGKGDYLLFIDADDWLEYDDDFQLPSLTMDAYLLCFGGSNFSYLKPQLVKADLPWEWVGVLHEYLACATPYSSAILNDVHYIIGGDGARSKDPEKYVKCTKMLEEALKDEPNNARYAFYLAESYRDADQTLKALEWYQKRIDMGGWEEEVFWSLLQIGHILSHLKANLDVVSISYYRAHIYRPHRPEPIYYLAEAYNQHHKYALAYGCIKAWECIPQPSKPDILFKTDWTQDWGIPFQRSIAAYWLDHFQEALDLCNQLVTREDLPEHIRKQIELNRKFSFERCHSVALP